MTYSMEEICLKIILTLIIFPRFCGEIKVKKVFIAVHGNMSNKEDAVIQILAEEANQKGYQVLSFDLPEHGERTNDNTPCKVQFCVSELSIIMNYAKEHWKEVSVFACSIGAYFSLLAYQNDVIEKALFLSPVVNMERIIENMMKWFNVTPELLQKRNDYRDTDWSKVILGLFMLCKRTSY